MDLQTEIKKNFPKIEKFFSDKKLNEFINTDINELDKFNFGLGTMIRLKLLRSKSTLYKCFKENGYINIDKMATLIMEEFYNHKNSL